MIIDLDQSILVRVRARVAKPDGNGCWLWTGEMFSNGYGHLPVVRDGVRRRPLAHRLVWQILVGDPSDDLTLDHLCRVRACVNPDHLEEVSAGENTRRGQGWIDGKCKRGHTLTPDNIYTARITGKRQCRACWSVRAAEKRRAS